MPTGLFDLRKLVKETKKTPAEVVQKALVALQALATDGPNKEKEQASIQKYLGFMKLWLFRDEQGHGPTRDKVIALAHEVVGTDLQLLIVQNIALLDFETRKDAALVFGAIVRIKDKNDTCPGAMYVQEHPQILSMLFKGYEDPNIALNCGSMYRDCIRDEALARMELYGPNFMEFFDRVEVANFEIASDAFSSFKDLLSRHKAVVAQFLADHYPPFFSAYAKLLQSSNYVTRRQSLKLLGELLLDRSNVRLMMRYVSDAKNLMQMMNMLKDSSRSIQFEAFHVFKVFVANPNKPEPIVEILVKNREKLLKYLEEFHTDRDEDEQFKEEKAVIIKEISQLGGDQQLQQHTQQHSQQHVEQQPPASYELIAQQQQPQVEQQQEQQPQHCHPSADAAEQPVQEPTAALAAASSAAHSADLRGLS